jgi:hypothetical protein
MKMKTKKNKIQRGVKYKLTVLKLHGKIFNYDVTDYKVVNGFLHFFDIIGKKNLRVHGSRVEVIELNKSGEENECIK